MDEARLTRRACHNDRMADEPDETPNGWQDPERPWWAKLRRAAQVIGEVSQACGAINSDEAAWSVQREADDDQSWRYRFHQKDIPADLAVLVADTIHNMRSALDQVAYYLARRYVGSLTEKQELRTNFPITSTPEAFDRWIGSRRDLYGEEERAALRCAQPFALREEFQRHFEGTGRSLESEQFPEADPREEAPFVLNTIWNIDKHRRLPRLTWAMPLAFWASPIPPTEYVWRPAAERKSLSDGTLIGQFRNRCGQGRPLADPSFEFEIRLDDSPSRGGSDLTRTLQRLHLSICGWVVPRIFIVADGHEPPLVISFVP
jgi:hypothetical protein